MKRIRALSEIKLYTEETLTRQGVARADPDQTTETDGRNYCFQESNGP